MCGIAGQLAFPSADPERARRMAALLQHRGPDGAGEFCDGPVALAHRRLSIIDVEGGAQPMRSDDGQIALAWNGEIYNFVELRDELGAEKFKTRSDTEVLLRAFERFGDEFLSRLRGMFAIALWDGRARRLLLARDRFGEKPLVYAQHGGALYFASELAALRAGVPELARIDRRALAHYLELLYVPAPRTPIEGCQKLPPGHLLVADERGVKLRQWFSPPAPGSGRPAPGADELRSKLSSAVRIALRSDVPIAALLSGGLDSASVVALASQQLSQPLRTFAVGFGRPDDELPAARLVAEKCHTDHHEIVIGGSSLEQAELAFAAFSEPFGDSSAVPTCAVMREVARETKVVLTGDGGDELFAGYDRYRLLQRMQPLPALRSARELAASLTGKARRAVQLLGPHGEARYRGLVEVFSAEERRALFGQTLPAAPASELDTATDADAALAFDLTTYLPNDLLFKLDQSAMRHSLEARAPLLDAELAEAVIPLPIGEKQSLAQGKLPLRAAMAELLPPQILARKKQGFGAPIADWLQGPLRPMLLDLVGSPSARVRDLFDDDAIDAALADPNPHKAWALLALEQWARRHA